MEENEMTMDRETHNLLEQYLDKSALEFDRVLAAGERKLHRRNWRWSAGIATACAAAAALVLWLMPTRQASKNTLTPIQIAEGIQQIMLLEIGDIQTIEATPNGSSAILTAHLKDGTSCSYIMKCDEVEGTTTLLAYNKKQ